MSDSRFRAALFLPFIAVALLMISCSGTAPVIENLQWRVLYRDDGQHRYEELSVFLRISDSDGPQDPALITITAGNGGLNWRFTSDEWISQSVNGQEWLGLPGIIPLNGFRLPDALYTISLEDLAGRTDKRTFRPDPDRLTDANLNWPAAVLHDGILQLEGPYHSGILILRDDEFNPLETIPVNNRSSVSGNGAVWWELWISLENTSGGFRLGPYPFLSVLDTE